MKTLFTHWKTSAVGLLIGVLTIMLIQKKIEAETWCEAIGAIGVVVGLLAKDWDKTDK